MKNSLNNNNKEVLLKKISSYSQSSYQWILNTPMRALDKAYQAALKIKLLEADYAKAIQEKSIAENANSTVINYLQSDIEKYLAIVKINLAEFKTSRFLFNSNTSNSWEKLVVIDEIIKKYRTDLIETSVVSPVSSIESYNSSGNKVNMEEDLLKVKPATEKSGVLPRSLEKTFQRIKNDLNGNNETEVLQSFRRSRRTTQMAIRCMLLLVVVPLFAQQLSREFIFFPLLDRMRVQNDTTIFLNSEMMEEAFHELQFFEEKLKFSNLLNQAPSITSEEKEKLVQEKVAELAEEFHHKSNVAISNVFADAVAFLAFAGVIFFNKKGIAAIKTFLDVIIYDLSDSAKAFIIILFTDIFVGFHSPHGWEVLLEGLANHLGIAPNHSAIFLFIATFPVILDTILKYWIFRYLNRISPSAVATLKNMNE